MESEVPEKFTHPQGGWRQGMARHRIDWRETAPSACRGGVLTIGNFDGVHRGHAGLVEEVARQARARSVPALVLTFEPHPRELLVPGPPQPLLTTPEDRSRLLEEHGADHILLLRTTAELLALSAEEFFQRVIRDQLQAVALVEGHNFGFGRGRQGNVETLERLCRPAGIPLTVVPPLLVDGRAVSSSQVRQALLAGNVELARLLLGRTYRIHGQVGTGQKRGQSLGFPTANLQQVSTLIPGDGVYAVVTAVGKRYWAGAANVGPNPTFGENQRKVEVHLIGFQGDLYGQELTVDFLKRLRDTRPFAGVDELVEQLKHDVEQARQAVRAFIEEGQ